MSEDHIFSTRFTTKETEIIGKFMKKHHIKNKNQLVRRAIEDLIGLSLADVTRNTSPLPPEYLAVYNFYRKYRQTLDSIKEQDELDQFFNIWKTIFFNRHTRKYNKKLSTANKIWNDFRKRNPVGRPKAPKGKRGKPSRKETSM